ncbi:uncharacterized protein LOC129596011 [Paramacrobiotus metropolitanus]|uniref:uncharacterized protein LOC129596011 n=1 Tax=Paramacrobiotus metropolitanus TaxID=2943436 RepID=UPI002445E55A|nr:uncharacterized protein LOC129596011 [Paramacrobiotus metropolitanus]
MLVIRLFRSKWCKFSKTLAGRCFMLFAFAAFGLCRSPPLASGAENPTITEYTCSFDSGLCAGWNITSNVPTASWTSTTTHGLQDHIHQNLFSFDGTHFMYTSNAARTCNREIWTELHSRHLPQKLHNTILKLLVSFWYFVPKGYGTLMLSFRHIDATKRDILHWMLRGEIFQGVSDNDMRWYSAQVPIVLEENGWLVFRFVYGRIMDAFAIDNVITSAYESLPSPNYFSSEPKSISCGFDTHLCGWTKYFDSGFKLETSEQSTYLVGRHNANLIHPLFRNYEMVIGSVPVPFQVTTNVVFSFRYYLGGNGVQQLRLFVSEAYDSMVVWERKLPNSIGDADLRKWISVELRLCMSVGSSLRFLVTTKFRGAEVRFDDFVYREMVDENALSRTPCGSVTCSFDQSLCGWSDRGVSSKWKPQNVADATNYAKPGTVDLVASESRTDVLVPIARLVSSCFDLEVATNLTDAYWTGATQMEGNRLIVKILHANRSEEFVGFLARNRAVILQPLRAARLIVEHAYPTGSARLPRISLLNESVYAKPSSQCAEYLPPLITNLPHIPTASCTFDRNLCGWNQLNSDQKFYIYSSYAAVTPYQGTGAVAALMLKKPESAGKYLFGLVSPKIRGKGRARLFFAYRADQYIEYASVLAKREDGSTAAFLWGIRKQDEPSRSEVWEFVRATYCINGEYTLELSARFQ